MGNWVTFVAELLKQGAAKVFVAARDPASLSDLLRGVTIVWSAYAVDVTDSTQVAAAVNAAPDVTFLVNNAGYAAFEDAISAPDLASAR
jgi:NADP-dependent 3-hydroxy acid dehydrogenase YdfG